MIQTAVHCHIGSLENTSFAAHDTTSVHCHIGSLESIAYGFIHYI